MIKVYFKKKKNNRKYKYSFNNEIKKGSLEGALDFESLLTA